jgi:phage shock protein PspC (stress-responsive transcriptional regulator)
MALKPLIIPSTSIRKLLDSLRQVRRNRQRGRLAGVCAGLADFLGVDVTLVRLAFVLSVFFSFSATFWIYLALWTLLPVKTSVPMPHVSWRLGRELRRIERLVRTSHRRLPPAIADQIQEAFDSIKILAPYFESAAYEAVTTISIGEMALQRFPALLKQMLSLPDGYISFRDTESMHSVAGIHAESLLGDLRSLNTELQQAAHELINREVHKHSASHKPVSSTTEVWQQRLVPLRERLSERASPKTLSILQGIEEKLVFLLDRIEENGVLDMMPFEVRKIAFDYLPDAIEQYLHLPSAMARSQVLSSGKTAEESLYEQLSLLDQTLQDTAKCLFENDAHGLLVHGRFLREKFGEQPFRL